MKLNKVSTASIPVPTYSRSDKARDRLTVMGCAGAKAVALAVGGVPAVASGVVGGVGTMAVKLLRHPKDFASSHVQPSTRLITAPPTRLITAGILEGKNAGLAVNDAINKHIWYKADNSRLRLSKDDECHRQKFENRIITHITDELVFAPGIQTDVVFDLVLDPVGDVRGDVTINVQL